MNPQMQDLATYVFSKQAGYDEPTVRLVVDGGMIQV